MSFVSFNPTPLRTREQIAREVHGVSLTRGLDELATVLALMCISVEVGTGEGDKRQWWCPWNAADPQTEQFDHDSQSDDGLSCGYFQQQVSRPGAPGQPWGWGGLFGDVNGVRKRMTLAESADMFLAALTDDYHLAADNPTLAGQFVQQVQKSKYPNRYTQRWGEAWDVLDRALATGPVTPTQPPTPRGAMDSPVTRKFLNANRYIGHQGQTPRWIAIHTQEGGGTADSLANFLKSTEGAPNPVSYHLVVDDREVIECCELADSPWSAVGANTYAYHVCLAGSYAAWSQGKWLETDASDGKNEDLELTNAARVVAWLCQQFKIPAIWIGGQNVPPWGLDGVCGHKDFGSWGGGHTDPGPNFPATEFMRRVNGFLAPTTIPQPPTGKPVIVGPADDQLNMRFHMLGDQTLLEAVAEIRDHLLGTNDRGKDGVVTL
ncbi:hypothetical protein E3G52_000383 [Mycobacteroides abscessus]|uniref:peptidoglycan recognition protein family protein n=1 Tax=Mycobacteroides abscessus TaxID=36809 RepID=UPI001877CA9D|nr:peptidoglycan recognition family protein [Mycobacteroides abscessus]MBE5453519.1 hypothetical protein [Mycobacteroides abscessus]